MDISIHFYVYYITCTQKISSKIDLFELLFFPNIKHIKVTKEDVRVKTFQLNMCPGTTEQLIEMCKMMANDILEGKKILIMGLEFSEVIKDFVIK